ncbi:hypothetical protein QYF36_014541 [Acer negundo]|nr:hypothetical protein QYF36_014541 [Acer negundo]
MNVRARQEASYFITFINDFTCFGHVYLISHISEALDCFKIFMNLVENQLDKKIKVLRTDQGREYLSNQFNELCNEKGIERQLTIPYTPQQNGVAERRNRTLLEMVRSMMAQANLPVSYWGDVLLTAAYILNRVPSKSVTSTPYELWTGRKPVLTNLRPWGCTGYAHNLSSQYGKLGARGKKHIFIRYSEHSKGYTLKCENSDGSVTELESRDVNFLENEFPIKGEVDKDVRFFELDDLNDDVNLNTLVEVDTNLPGTSVPSGSNAVVQPASGDLQTQKSNRRAITHYRFEIEGETFMVASHEKDEPKNANEALNSPAKKLWMKAMEEEIESMEPCLGLG